MKRSLYLFQRLQWKMMFPYILTIPFVMLLIEIIWVIAAIVIIELFFLPGLLLYSEQQSVIQVRPFFVHHGVADQQALAEWIRIPVSFATYQPKIRGVVNKQGQMIAESDSSSLPLNVAPQEPSISAHLQQVLTSKGNDNGSTYQTSDGSVIVIVPIRGNDHTIVGALFDDSGPDLATRETAFWISFYLPTFLVSALFFFIVSFIISIVGSFYTAHNFARRFRKIAIAVDPWGKGDFSTFIYDTSRDEIGQLAQQLNRMAEQLQNLLQSRQRLATLEERYRLARDLHDSVKQLIFVAVLQVGAAKIQLGAREGATQQRLSEAEGILKQVQEELATLIHELRPVLLEEKGFNAALRVLTTQWSRQTGIVTSVQIEGENQQALPPLAEEALFRITQEALSNVIRHSQATCVQISLVYQPDKVVLSLSDNGQGFDTTLNQEQGVGLTYMHERLAAIGGEMRLESTPKVGTSILISYERQLTLI
jgi:signal transduction histidine kinase